MARGVAARRIAYSLATTQAGMLSRGQLLDCGVSNDVIAHWLGSGHMFRFLPGVYALGRPAEAVESFWMAGLLFAGHGSLLAGRSAAQAWGISNPGSRIEVAKRRGVRRFFQGSPPHEIVRFEIRKASLEASDLALIGPVAVMNPARLLIDLAGRESRAGLRRVFIEAGRTDLLTPECLDRIESRSRGFNGRENLMTLCAHWDPTKGKIRSILEGEFKLMCAEQALPAPETNATVGPFEVDGLFESEKVVVELDGRKFHNDPVALERDAYKTRELRRMGYRVLRFTWNDIVERPEWAAAQIRRELGSNC